MLSPSPWRLKIVLAAASAAALFSSNGATASPQGPQITTSQTISEAEQALLSLGYRRHSRQAAEAGTLLTTYRGQGAPPFGPDQIEILHQGSDIRIVRRFAVPRNATVTRAAFRQALQSAFGTDYRYHGFGSKPLEAFVYPAREATPGCAGFPIGSVDMGRRLALDPDFYGSGEPCRRGMVTLLMYDSSAGNSRLKSMTMVTYDLLANGERSGDTSRQPVPTVQGSFELVETLGGPGILSGDDVARAESLVGANLVLGPRSISFGDRKCAYDQWGEMLLQDEFGSSGGNWGQIGFERLSKPLASGYAYPVEHVRFYCENGEAPLSAFDSYFERYGSVERALAHYDGFQVYVANEGELPVLKVGSAYVRLSDK